MRVTWIIDGVLAISPFPHIRLLEELYDEGIRAIVSLEYHDKSSLEKMGFEHLDAYVKDYTAPHFCQLLEINNFIDKMADIKKPVLIHCYAGGRSGTAAASYLIHKKNITAGEALREVRNRFPNAVETKSQEKALMEFEILTRKLIFLGKLKCLKRKILLRIPYIFKRLK